MKKVELGDRVVDIVTGFSGIATAKCDYLSGESRIEVTREVQPEEKMETSWCYEKQLKVLDPHVFSHNVRGVWRAGAGERVALRARVSRRPEKE